MADPVDPVFDPFPSDPAIVAMGKSDKDKEKEKSSFNPDVSPFTPAVPELGSWKVIAAEYTGKAVAVMQTPEGILVCTSPSFNSKCRHPGVSCLDWDNVKLSPATGAGSQPDSGLDNTDQSSEDRDKIERVAQWSEDAAKHTVQLSEEYIGTPNDWSDSNTFQPAPDWNLTDSGQSPMWSGPEGETHMVQWSPVTHESTNVQTQYNNLHITVEYHSPQDSYTSPVGPEPSFLSPMVGDETTVIGRSGFGNDPLFVCPGQQWETAGMVSPSESCYMSAGAAGMLNTDDSWSMGLGMDLSRLALNSDTSLDNVTQEDLEDQNKKREEFKKTILSNIGLAKEQSAEDKIRQDFKQKILSNLDKSEFSSAAKPDPDAKIREDFKSQILSNLNS